MGNDSWANTHWMRRLIVWPPYICSVVDDCDLANTLARELHSKKQRQNLYSKRWSGYTGRPAINEKNGNQGILMMIKFTNCGISSVFLPELSLSKMENDFDGGFSLLYSPSNGNWIATTVVDSDIFWIFFSTIIYDFCTVHFLWFYAYHGVQYVYTGRIGRWVHIE